MRAGARPAPRLPAPAEKGVRPQRGARPRRGELVILITPLGNTPDPRDLPTSQN